MTSRRDSLLKKLDELKQLEEDGESWWYENTTGVLRWFEGARWFDEDFDELKQWFDEDIDEDVFTPAEMAAVAKIARRGSDPDWDLYHTLITRYRITGMLKTHHYSTMRRVGRDDEFEWLDIYDVVKWAEKFIDNICLLNFRINTTDDKTRVELLKLKEFILLLETQEYVSANIGGDGDDLQNSLFEEAFKQGYHWYPPDM